MKASKVYKTNHFYKVITQSITKAGFLLSVMPVYLVPLNLTDFHLKKAVFESISSSKNKIYTPQRHEFALLEKEIMNEINERSYTSLYKTSSSCDIRVIGKDATIYPERYLDLRNPNLGLTWVEEEMVLIKNAFTNKDEVIKVIKNLLAKDFR